MPQSISNTLGTQGAALGRSIKRQIEELGLPPITRVVSSPLLRCVQTAAEAARELGIHGVGIERGLFETMGEDWYRSWAVPGADGTWGGPLTCRSPTPVYGAHLHTHAVAHVSKCQRSAEELAALMDIAATEAGIEQIFYTYT